MVWYVWMEEETEVFLSIIKDFFFLNHLDIKLAINQNIQAEGLPDAVANIMLEIWGNSPTERSDGEEKALQKWRQSDDSGRSRNGGDEPAKILPANIHHQHLGMT